MATTLGDDSGFGDTSSTSQTQPDREAEVNLGDINQFLWHHGKRLWNDFKIAADGLLDETGVYANLDRLSQLATAHPYLAMCLIAATISVSLPFLIIIGICISTVVMTFTGFVLLEGTLITIASVILFGILSSLVVVFAFFGGIIIAGYFGFIHICDFFKNGDTARTRTHGNNFNSSRARSTDIPQTGGP